ncbi:MAG: hypothetical protein JWN37_784 [Candidatus Nomurabacteria bacterium]|nr:hypothetical protein [Candidatus Nomurabacteria bacterium]
MRRVKTLLLGSRNNLPPLVEAMREKGIFLDVTAEEYLGVVDHLARYTPEVAQAVRTITAEDHELDLVILHNSAGQGVSKAECINIRMRDKTLVAWGGNYSPSEERPYREMGFQNFFQYFFLRSKILEMFPIEKDARKV